MTMKKRVQRTLCSLLACCLIAASLTLPAAAAGFRDVPAGHWAAESIERCVQLGLFQGESATTFGVGHEMSRAAFTVVLSRLFGWETKTPAQSVYDDVPADAWYAGAVAAAYANGALTLQSTSFRPNDPITREELAVMMVRALGYGGLAGLAQDQSAPFRDVTTNAGYITMAYELGLVSGTTATTFSPDQTATREQAAVMLVRLYDKLHAAAPGKVGIAASAEDLPDLAGFDAVAVTAGQLVYQNGTVSLTATGTPEKTAALRAAISAAGVGQLLHVTGADSVLRGDSDQMAKLLAAAVQEQGYDGVLLDLQTVRYSYRKNLTALAGALNQALGDGALYLVVQAPSQEDQEADDGYEYAALAAQADGLVVRVAAQEERGEFPTAPMEPLDAVYYAFAQLTNQVAPEKLSLLLTTTASVWKDGKRSDVLTGAQASALLASGQLEEHYSNGYACAYLSGVIDDQETVVWYLNEEAVSQRVTLAACFGVDQVCLTEANGLWPGLLETLH